MVAPVYTVLKTNIMNELKLYGVQFCLAYGVAREESLS